jgi:bifunctional non-homologous end joining protein LigD
VLCSTCILPVPAARFGSSTNSSRGRWSSSASVQGQSTGDWLKIKCVQSDTFAVVGHEPSTALPGAIASLLLAARYRDGWQYVGNVGTGFKHDEARRLKKQLDKLKTGIPVVSVSGKDLVMTSPSLIAEIEYRAWTHTGTLRHASFKGPREEEDWAQVYRLPDYCQPNSFALC